MERIIALLFLISIGLFGYSQDTRNINDSNSSVLYRGFQNRFEIMDSSWQNSDYSLECVGCEVTLDRSNELFPNPQFTLYTKDSKQAILTYIRPDKDTIRHIFEVRNLPAPGIYLNDNSSDSEIRKQSFDSNGTISIGYPKEVTLISKFNVLAWEIQLGGRPISGYGGVLSDLATKMIQRLDNGTEITIVCTVSCSSDGIQRKMAASFIIVD